MKKKQAISMGAAGKTAARRMWSFLLSLAVFITMFPLTPLSVAAEPVTITHNINTQGSLTAVAGNNYLVVGTGIPTQDYIQVPTGYAGTITIKDIKLRRNIAIPCLNVDGNADVTLKLMGDNEMIFNAAVPGTAASTAMLRVAPNAMLKIESYNGVDTDGTLTVKQTTSVSGAAIGSNQNTNNGTVIINSGTIHATGGDDAAGIGGGSGGNGGTIKIYGGNVTAICDSRTGTNNTGAAIGAGFNYGTDTNTKIEIYGGIVTASSLLNDGYYLSGSAIGAGNANSNTSTAPNSGNFGYILIAGGTIRASVRGLFDGPADPITGLPTHTEMVNGRDGVAIGGGANPNCTGTIIILPSADVTELYGGRLRGPLSSTDPCWDIGNADKIFYLNSASAKVAAKDSGIRTTKIFTARTQDNTAPGMGSDQYTKNADIYVRVPDADPYLPAFAAKVGNTGSSGIYGDALDLNYYTNLAVDYFTKTKKTDGTPFETKTVPTSSNPLIPDDLNPGESYNSGTNVFNLVLGDASSTGVGIEVSGPYNPLTAANPPVAIDILPDPPGAGGAWSYIDPTTFQNSGVIDLHFGEYDFVQTGASPNTVGGYPNPYDQLKLQIKNTGDLPMNITADQSGIQSFTISGPGITPPVVAGGESLPPRSAGTITVTRKAIVRAGDRVEPLVLHVTNDTVSPPYDETITINLRIKVNQEQLHSSSGNKASATATYPPAPASLSGPATQTNSSSVNMLATANNASIDGVKNIWYAVTTSSTGPHTPSPSAGHTPDGDPAWTKVSATPKPDGSYNYSKSFSAPFPAADGTYYIHWYVETENTIASDGVLGPYEVLRNTGLQPALTGPSSASSSIPYTVTVTFNRPVTGLLESHFQVTNGAVVSGTLNPSSGPSATYTVQVQANGNGDCMVALPANRVKDVYGNFNLVSNSLVSTLDNASPAANFTGIQPMYFEDTSGIQFKLSSGIVGDPNLFLSDGTTAFTGANGLGTGQITLTRDGSPVALTASDISFSGNTFTITKPLGEGQYRIDIAAGSIKNTLGLGIANSTRDFEVRVPVVSSVSANPNSYTHVGGPVTITVNGVNLEHATASNNKELLLDVMDSNSGSHGPLAVSVSGGVGTATFAAPANTTMFAIDYDFFSKIGGVSTGHSDRVRVDEAPAAASGLLVTENSDGSGGASALELPDTGGTIYFVVDGVNLHNMNLGLDNSGPATLPMLVNSDFILNGNASQAKSIGMSLSANITQADEVYTFELTDGGSPTGKTVTVTVKKPELGVDANSFTPTYDKHPSAGGTTTFSMTGQHMDIAGTDLTLQITPVDDDGNLDMTRTAWDEPVTTITGGGTGATQAVVFPAHNPAKLRNDLYKVVVVFNHQEVPGCEAKVEVGDDVPSLTGIDANPSYFASVNDTLNGRGQSVITVHGNYLFNFGSLQLHDKIYDRMYTVPNAGKDMEADCTVTVPSAVGIYEYDLYCEGQKTQYTAVVHVGVALGTSSVPAAPTNENPETDKQWDRRGGGAKGGGFTGRRYVPFDVLRYQSEVAARENQENPSVTLLNIGKVVQWHFNLAMTGARTGAGMAAVRDGKGVITLHFDTSERNDETVLEGRLSLRVDMPLPDMYPGVFLDEVETGETRQLFTSRFDNKNLLVVCLDQNGSYGTRAEVAVNADLTGFNAESLYFYRYDRETGQYARMTNTGYFIDTADFLHFFTEKGGDIIVTDKPLTQGGKASETGILPTHAKESPDKRKEDDIPQSDGGNEQ